MCDHGCYGMYDGQHCGCCARLTEATQSCDRLSELLREAQAEIEELEETVKDQLAVGEEEWNRKNEVAERIAAALSERPNG